MHKSAMTLNPNLPDQPLQSLPASSQWEPNEHHATYFFPYPESNLSKPHKAILNIKSTPRISVPVQNAVRAEKAKCGSALRYS